jgi:prepilin-type N-terminal cleavage/methylation domain-containing protein
MSRFQPRSANKEKDMGKGHVKGFTLVELVIVIVIIGILSVIAVPIYRGYTRRTMASEGKALLATISASEQAYLAQNGQCLTVNPAVSFNPELMLTHGVTNTTERFR